MNQIQVIVKRAGEKPEVTSINNDLETFQTLVDGYIEVVSYRGVDVVVNEEGKLRELPFNFYLYSDFIVGTAIFTQHDDEGDFISLKPEEIAMVLSMFR